MSLWRPAGARARPAGAARAGCRAGLHAVLAMALGLLLAAPVAEAQAPAAPPRRPAAQAPLPPPPPAPPALPAAARPPLVAELSQAQVAITTGFSGTEVLVFGATERLLGAGGDDVLVIAQGPAQPMVVRRKVRVLGLWLNGASARFWRVPGYYLLAGTRPLAEVLSEEERAAKRIGLEALPLEAAGNQQSEFREALMELKQAAGLWGEAGSMHIAGARLFRASLPLPATVPTGDYLVQVLLVREGRVVARQELGFRVGRVGTAARIANVAKVQPVVYGLLCILLAALAGWLGSVLFRRG